MSNTPFFDALIAEYGAKGSEILKTMSTPFLAPVKAPLPKRSVAQLIQVPEPDPEFAKQLQEFIQTMPMQILEGTPAGSFIKSMDVVKDDDTGELMLEAEVMVPPVQTVKEDVADTVAMLNGMRPKLAWVDEWQSGDPDEDEIYIAPVKPIAFERVQSELKTDMVAEDVRQRQLALYHHGVMEGREKAAQLHDDRFVPPMSEKTMPSWIADEIRESNESLSDPEMIDPDEFNPVPPYIAIDRKDGMNDTTPEQTDESVNAASNNTDSTSTVKPLWVSHEE